MTESEEEYEYRRCGECLRVQKVGLSIGIIIMVIGLLIAFLSTEKFAGGFLCFLGFAISFSFGKYGLHR